MNRFLIACFAATGYCGLAAAANATPGQNGSQPVAAVANTIQQNGGMPYMFADMQNEIQSLRTDVQTLGSLDRQLLRDPRYVFSAELPPNPDGAPIPAGG